MGMACALVSNEQHNKAIALLKGTTSYIENESIRYLSQGCLGSAFVRTKSYLDAIRVFDSMAPLDSITGVEAEKFRQNAWATNYLHAVALYRTKQWVEAVQVYKKGSIRVSQRDLHRSGEQRKSLSGHGSAGSLGVTTPTQTADEVTHVRYQGYRKVAERGAPQYSEDCRCAVPPRSPGPRVTRGCTDAGGETIQERGAMPAMRPTRSAGAQSSSNPPVARPAISVAGREVTLGYAPRARSSTRSRRDTQTLRALEKHNRRIYRAWRLKDEFEQLWTFNAPWAALRFFKRWTTSALRSRLEPLRRFVATARRHQAGILAFVETRVTNAVAEGLNRIVKIVVCRTHGRTEEIPGDPLGRASRAGQLSLRVRRAAPVQGDDPEGGGNAAVAANARLDSVRPVAPQH